MTVPSSLQPPAPPLTSGPGEASILGGRQRRGFIPVYLLGFFGMQLALLTSSAVSIPLRVAQLNPGGKADTVALVASVSGLVAMVATPLYGRLSDRSTSRFGMRKPFILGGAVFGGLALIGVGLSPTVPLLLLFVGLTQAGFSATTAATWAILSDQIPHHIRARVSAGLGAAQGISTAIGGFLISGLGDRHLLWFAIPAVFAAIVNIALALTLRDVIKNTKPAPFDWKTFIGSYWVSPRRHPDFAWAWWCRLFVTMSIVMVSTYLLYFITDAVGLPNGQAASATSIVLLVYFLANMLTVFIMVWLSDRTGKRKFIVICSAILTAIGILTAALSTGFIPVLIGIAIAGMGGGAYISVDMALMTEVLPGNDEAGKDLGVVSLANLLPQVLVSLVALPILTLTGNNYRAVVLSAVALATLGAIAVIPIRKVR